MGIYVEYNWLATCQDKIYKEKPPLNKMQYFRLRLYDSDLIALDCSLTAR